MFFMASMAFCACSEDILLPVSMESMPGGIFSIIFFACSTASGFALSFSTASRMALAVAEALPGAVGPPFALTTLLSRSAALAASGLASAASTLAWPAIANSAARAFAAASDCSLLLAGSGATGISLLPIEITSASSTSGLGFSASGSGTGSRPTRSLRKLKTAIFLLTRAASMTVCPLLFFSSCHSSLGQISLPASRISLSTSWWP
mmetsp:Transcript_71478/g.209914  ORF Transcript_71478/g.209914 Transcript_71478/m.209914 type:complete len:207 (-) Transcript_71478:1823-2443(-)